MSNLKIRLISAAIGIPLLLYSAATGGVWLLVVIIGIQFLLLSEWRIFAAAMNVRLGVQYLAVILLGIDFLVMKHGNPVALGAAITALYVWILSSVFSRARAPLIQLGLGALFLVYAAAPLSMWILIHEISSPLRHGPLSALGILFVATWICDSSAYFAGRSFGRHKLFPEASPNKTVEGAVGGLLAAALLLPCLSLLRLVEPEPLDYLILPVLVGVAGQMGDLIESLMKREVQIKDVSNLIPGHGGFLDRFDSLLLSTPLYLVFLYATTP